MSTDEKLGVEELEVLPDKPPLEPEVELLPDVALPPDAALPPEDGVVELAPLEPLAPEAAGDDDLSAPPEVLDEELCASVTPDSANNAAAVAALRTFSFNIGDTSLQGK